MDVMLEKFISRSVEPPLTGNAVGFSWLSNSSELYYVRKNALERVF